VDLKMMQGIVETDLWAMVAISFIVGLIGMLLLVYKKTYLLTGSAFRLQGTMMMVVLVVLMMGVTLTSWFLLAAINPDLVISPFELSQFWGAVLTIGGIIFIVALTAGFIALHVYRGGA
jgi:hypothetical protein